MTKERSKCGIESSKSGPEKAARTAGDGRGRPPALGKIVKDDAALLGIVNKSFVSDRWENWGDADPYSYGGFFVKWNPKTNSFDIIKTDEATEASKERDSEGNELSLVGIERGNFSLSDLREIWEEERDAIESVTGLKPDKENLIIWLIQGHDALWGLGRFGEGSEDTEVTSEGYDKFLEENGIKEWKHGHPGKADGKRGTMNDSARTEWVNNDEGLYNIWKSSRKSISAFVKENRELIDEVAGKIISGEKRPSYLAYPSDGRVPVFKNEDRGKAIKSVVSRLKKSFRPDPKAHPFKDVTIGKRTFRVTLWEDNRVSIERTDLRPDQLTEADHYETDQLQSDLNEALR